MIWKMIHPQFTFEMLGYIPQFLSEHDPRPARKQIDSNYKHGSGWSPFEGFTMLPSGDLSYPDDPPVRLLAEAKLRNETIRFYEHAWVAIVQPDGSYEISRVD